MTRMWLVNPTHLCRKHLLGEHAELHQLTGTLNNHPHGTPIAHGHARKGNIDTTQMHARHDALVQEFARRGYTHDSPLAAYDGPSIGEGCVDVARNRRDLADRCEDCAGRIRDGDEA